MEDFEDPSEVDLFSRGAARGRIGCQETYLGWPKEDPSSPEFMENCLEIIRRELMEASQVRGGAIEIPIEKFGTELDLIRFLVKCCTTDWLRESGLFIFTIGKKKKNDKFAVGIRGQEKFWQSRRARDSYKASRIETYGLPEYGEELMKVLYGGEELGSEDPLDSAPTPEKSEGPDV